MAWGIRLKLTVRRRKIIDGTISTCSSSCISTKSAVNSPSIRGSMENTIFGWQTFWNVLHTGSQGDGQEKTAKCRKIP
ncbi:hypothetical protein MKX03_022340 [Papaver bracteatum]|nr:hypothetical protein MKX03_022340 [Papaver bracteatum]